MTVGDRIKEKRIALNMSQDELAKKVGYKSRSSIQKIESARSLPLSKVVRMANALDCTPAYLMGWEENPTDINEEAGKLYSAYAFRVLYDSLPLEEQEKINEIEKQLVNLTPENRTLILNLLKSLLPDA